jgi:hypothetical protein
MVRFLSRRIYRENIRKNRRVETYFKNHGLKWEYAIFKAEEKFNRTCKKDKAGGDRIGRSFYEIDETGRISVVLLNFKDRLLARYEVTNPIVLKKVRV